MLNVVSETTEQLASAGKATRETHMRDAGSMNASLTASVPTTWLAKMKSVSTLAMNALSTLTVLLEITEPFVNAWLATQEILMAQFAAKVRS